MKKVKITSYYRCPKTNKIFSLYQVRVKTDNGRYEYFPSEEHAKAFQEERKPTNAWINEIPDEDVRKTLM